MLLSHDAELLRNLVGSQRRLNLMLRGYGAVLVVQWIGALWHRTLAGNCRRLGDIILSDRWLESIQVRKDPMNGGNALSKLKGLLRLTDAINRNAI